MKMELKCDFRLHNAKFLLPHRKQTTIQIPMAKLFLGLDSSTQSISAVVIDCDRRKVVYDKSLNFDQALPQYKTQNGVLPNRNPLVKHSSPLMWAEALDRLFAVNEKGRRQARQHPRHQRQRPAARLGLFE
jgi:hypothetical protein